MTYLALGLAWFLIIAGSGPTPPEFPWKTFAEASHDAYDGGVVACNGSEAVGSGISVKHEGQEWNVYTLEDRWIAVVFGPEPKSAPLYLYMGVTSKDETLQVLKVVPFDPEKHQGACQDWLVDTGEKT